MRREKRGLDSLYSVPTVIQKRCTTSNRKTITFASSQNSVLKGPLNRAWQLLIYCRTHYFSIMIFIYLLRYICVDQTRSIDPRKYTSFNFLFKQEQFFFFFYRYLDIVLNY